MLILLLCIKNSLKLCHKNKREQMLFWKYKEKYLMKYMDIGQQKVNQIF